MNQLRNTIALLALSTLLTAHPALAASEDDFKAAYAAADAPNKQAGQLRDQWTVTVTALSDAMRAAESGDFDKAIAASKEAEALAKASLFQATHEKDAWKAMEIK